MTSINLLPWRALEQQREQRLFKLALLIGVVMSLFFTCILSFYWSGKINQQQRLNRELDYAMQSVKQRLRTRNALFAARKDLLLKIQLLEKLQAHRELTIHFFDEISIRMPPDIYFIRMEKLHEQVRFHGVASSPLDVAHLLHNLKQSHLLEKVVLTEVIAMKEEGKRGFMQFKMTVWLRLTSSTIVT